MEIEWGLHDHAKVKRKLAAILSAVKGYSRLMGEDEKRTRAARLSTYRKIIGHLITISRPDR